MPVRIAPSVPPTPCTPNVSSASSLPSQALSFQQARNGMIPARMPIIIAPLVFTKPQAGVITTRPATIPEQNPRILGLPLINHSAIAQTKPAVAAASVVVVKAFAAMLSAPSALPALKPYQPTQSIPVPIIHMTMLWGGIGCLGKPRRGPRIKQRISADQPEVMCTTVPPAKSIALIFAL